ncbi:MAG: Ig-like domain-containing domain [Planctomycetota bacterium]|jgi:hypothetical protein
MRRLHILGACIFALALTVGCTGGAAGDPSDDIGDIFVLTHSPGNGDTMRDEDADISYNALSNPTLTNPGAVTLVFTNSVDPASVLNPDPSDLQGTRNVRLFFFDTNQGPYDPQSPTVPGVNPPGANRIVPATTSLTQTNVPNDTLIIRPTGVSALTPLPDGQYSLVVEKGVRGADGDGMKGQEFFFFFRVNDDNLGPVVVRSSPAAGERNVDPSTEIRITMSETILASTVSNANMSVSYQPSGSTAVIGVPGNWFTDGGNGPGNNVPAIQLDGNGNPGFSGTSPRNGVDLVFKPDLDAFPVNMNTLDPFADPTCGPVDPPFKGNHGLPLGQSVSVRFSTTGVGITDTAGNPVPIGSPGTTFAFETKPKPEPVFAPKANAAIYFYDTVGVGVIDVDPIRTPYLVGPNPKRSPNSVVTTGTGFAQNVVRVPMSDLADMTTDTRPYTSFFSHLDCGPLSPSLWFGNVYAVSRSEGGGSVLVIDSYQMTPMGRFGTPSPGGISLTASGALGMAAVSNFSANTVTVFDVGLVDWIVDPNFLYATISSLGNAVTTGSAKLILSETDFEKVFPHQRADPTSPTGPPILGTISVGISPTRCKITGLPNSLGFYAPPFCYAPLLTNTPIVCALNAGENTADFSELVNLNQSGAIEPDLDGVNLSSQPLDAAWTPWSFTTGSYHFFIASVGGTVELFASGRVANQPSVRPNSSSNLQPNKIINNIGGLKQPNALQWNSAGNGTILQSGGYTLTVLVAETGEDRIQQLSVLSEYPSNLFQATNSNLPAGEGPVDITGDPSAVNFTAPCTPHFFTYYVANAGQGTVRTGDYTGGIIGTNISVPGVQKVVSWWSR